MVGFDGLVVGKLVGRFDQPAVRADEVVQMSHPWKTCLQASLTLHNLGLGHVLPFEDIGGPVREAFGDEFHFEIVHRRDVGEDDFEEFRWDVFERSRHRGYR